MTNLPRARQSGLVIEELPGETLVYDSERESAMCLNQAAASVWKHCDGKTTAARMARLVEKEFQITRGDEVVALALERLEKSYLLTGKTQIHLPRISRRELVRRLGIAAALIPVITFIMVPTARAQASCFPTGTPCTANSECCSGGCVDNGRGVFECT
ncbi:MAG: PqqD family peptide modification chaperone [Pyrinomonadaceae bacterium]